VPQLKLKLPVITITILTQRIALSNLALRPRLKRVAHKNIYFRALSNFTGRWLLLYREVFWWGESKVSSYRQTISASLVENDAVCEQGIGWTGP